MQVLQVVLLPSLFAGLKCISLGLLKLMYKILCLYMHAYKCDSENTVNIISSKLTPCKSDVT